MGVELSVAVIETIKQAAGKLTGFRRRAFQAEVATTYCDGSPRRAERVFGWGRDAVNTGLQELRIGIRCCDDFTTRGRRKLEEQSPQLADEIHALVEPASQADPKFQTPFGLHAAYGPGGTRAVGGQDGGNQSAAAGRTHAAEHPEPARLSAAAGPQNEASKKLPATDAIFDHLRHVHTQAEADSETLRISLDTKAKVKIGKFSRDGLARGRQAVRAADHDMHPEAVLAPAGILEVDSAQLNIVFGTSRDTSDFVVDCLDLWWNECRAAYPGVRRLLIDLDNGPEIASSRTQFMRRLVEFSDRQQLTLELAYYPPYHSKYNPIERCWASWRITGTARC